MRAFSKISIGLAVVVVALWGIAAAADLTPVEQLGKEIYFDNISNPPSMACATCHAVRSGFTGPTAGINQPFNYRIEVTNPGDQVASGVVVSTDDLGSDVEYISSNPKPSQYGNRYEWNLGVISPGGQLQAIDIQLRSAVRAVIPAKAGNYHSSERWYPGVVMWAEQAQPV